MACLSSLAARRRLALPLPMCGGRGQDMPKLWCYILSCKMPVQPLCMVCALCVVLLGKPGREAAARSGACMLSNIRWGSLNKAQGHLEYQSGPPWQARMILTDLPWPRDS